MMKKTIFLIIAIAGMLVFTGCQKENQSAKESAMAISNAQDQVLISDLVIDLIDDIELTSEIIFGELKTGSSDCRTVTVVPMDRVTWPKTITIDFGTEGCLVREDVVKKGKIIINQSAPQRAEAWEKVITFENYFVNDNQIEGTHTLTYHVRSGHPIWTNTLTNSKVTTPEGVIRTRMATHIRVQTRGTETLRERMDDVFQITGNASGTNREGKTFSWVIKEPLVMHMGCRWIRAGIKEINLEGQSTAVLDFGNGECDNLATITRDGEVKEITLKGFRRR
jgi:hypothetical protein